MNKKLIQKVMNKKLIQKVTHLIPTSYKTEMYKLIVMLYLFHSNK